MSDVEITVKPLRSGHDSSPAEKGPHPINRQALRRLKSIEGQVRGVQRMVEQEKYCIDILDQISAVRSALNSVGMVILKRHIESCVTDAIEDGDQRKSDMIDELMKLLSRNQL